jgi:hypothetical protein
VKELTMQLPPHSELAPIAEMVGATSDPLYLSDRAKQISIPIYPPTGPASLRAEWMLPRVYLNIENITCDVDAPSYEVYLNLPAAADPAKHPALLVGSLPMFGLVETSRANQQHPDNGLTYKLDITNVYLRQATTRDWDAKNLRVTFVPENWSASVRVQVGRVSVYIA